MCENFLSLKTREWKKTKVKKYIFFSSSETKERIQFFFMKEQKSFLLKLFMFFSVKT